MNDTEVSIKFRNSVTGEGKLEKYANQLNKINSAISGLDKGVISQIDNSANSLSNIGNETKKINSDSKSLAFNFKNAFGIGRITMFVGAIKGLATSIGKLTSQSAAYLENMNLLDVAFNNDTREADKFVNKLSEMYGLDESWGYRTVGIFKQLANAMGLANELGTKLSTTLTQFSIDVASLYNMDTDSAVQILQSALAGQTKPARRLGADITQTTLQTTLDQAGIDKYVTGLSYVEKRLLIVSSLLQQVSEANNDWGRTIESVANQTRILSEQWDRFTRSLGNVFLPIVKKILPYLNAILMVLTEIVNSVAIFLGFNEEDFDFFSETDSSVIDLITDLDGASSSAKKLKQGLRGFDKLNIITTPSSSGVSSGTGGIDPKIMKLFNEELDKYNSKLTNTKMKATDIRDTILDSLGYAKLINEETGEVDFKFTGFSKKLPTINPYLQKIKLFFTTLKKSVNFFTKPVVEDFDKLSGASDKTVNRLKPVQKAFDNLKKTITNISYDNLPLTKEEKQKIIDSINDLTESLKTALNDYVNEQIKNLNYLYYDMGLIDEQEYKRRLKDLEKYQKDENKDIDKHSKELKDKTTTLYDENGNIIFENYANYLNELDKYENKSYQNMATGEEDKQQLLKNYQNMSKQDQIQYYSDLLQGYAKDRDSAIQAAKDKRDKTIQAAKDTYGESSPIYKRIVEEANKRYDDEVTKANETYDDIYNKFKTTNEDIASYINKDDGHILTGWQKFCSDIKTTFSNAIEKIKTWWKNLTLDEKETNITVHSGGNYSTKPKANGGIYANGSWHDIRNYATGGLPPVGQMFVAREKGPELVGKIGSHTAVMNNDQIVGSVASGVYDAVSKAMNNNSKPMNATFIIQVGDKEIARQVITDLQDMAKTNGKAITIGG